MRVIIEMNADEGRSVVLERHPPAAQEQGAAMRDQAAGAASVAESEPAPVSAAALDGGGPSPALLMALGLGEAEEEDEAGPDASGEVSDGTIREGGTSAGGPPDWLTDILSRAPE
jgi:hypothetical protein